MTATVIDSNRLSSPMPALVGNPNCGKTALFNLLTGSHQKVANCAGVTRERKQGWVGTPAGQRLAVLDPPGTYSLTPNSPDEQVTCDVLAGRLPMNPLLADPLALTIVGLAAWKVMCVVRACLRGAADGGGDRADDRGDPCKGCRECRGQAPRR